MSASDPPDTILVVDLTTMVEDLPSALKKESTELELSKGFGRTLLRLLERLRLQNVTLVAYHDCCPLLIKLARALPQAAPMSPCFIGVSFSLAAFLGTLGRTPIWFD